MKAKWKRIKNCFLVVFSICLMLGFSIPSHAYTEAEIAQARAWLSSHGYSPDRSGAAAAYRDYLNGRFDEELGRTTTESTTENDSNSTEDGRTTEDRNNTVANRTTEESEEMPELLLNPFDSDLIEEVDALDDESNDTGDSEAANRGNAAGNGVDDSDVAVTMNGVDVADAGDEIKKQNEILSENDESRKATEVDAEAIVKEETSRVHKDTLLVIAISVGLMAVVEILLYMKAMS